MKILKWLLIVIVASIAALVGIAFFLPDHAHVERSIVIERPPATVFTLLNGFRRFNEWSPWADLDPKAITTYEGPVVGVGSKMSWTSEDPNVGAGSQEILEAQAPSFIKVRLIFADFESDNVATYRLAPEGAGTKVTWAYDTDFRGNLMGRWFGMMLDSMLGPDYEKGLAKLKTVVETLPATDVAGLEVQVEDLEEADTGKAGLTLTVKHVGPSEALPATYEKLTAWKQAAGFKDNGAPWEQPVSDPASTPAAELVTLVHLPVK